VKFCSAATARKYLMWRSSIAIGKTYQEWEPHSMATRRVSESAVPHNEIAA
jgi:hypothetical protein